MGISDQLTCLCETYMQVKKQQLEPDMEQLTVSKLGKEYDKAVYFHPDYLISVQSTSYEMSGWMNHKREKYQQPQTRRQYHTNGRKWRATKDLLDEGETGEWKKLA